MHFHIATLFPEAFPGVLSLSVTGKAYAQSLWNFTTHNVRDYAYDTRKSVDDTPFGGGAGMVLRPDVVGSCLDSIPATSHRLFFTPRGRSMTQGQIEKYAKAKSLTLLCGRYEGVDERVIRAYDVEEWSMGDYILSGGEVAALSFMDAVIRCLKGTLGNAASHDDESYQSDLLEYPQYTRPEIWSGFSVPNVLLSGHHANIKAWRLRQAQRRTREKRPDLWRMYCQKREENEYS